MRDETATGAMTPRSPGLAAATATLAFTLLTIGVPAKSEAQPRSMVVHLPEAPIESMGKLGEGVTQLASYLARSVPDLALEVKAFRKSADARAFIASAAPNGSVTLVASDAAFALDLPPGFEVVHRFARNGRETRSKLVVVKSTSGITSLAGLRGRSLTVAMAEGPATDRFLSEAVFGNEVDARSWFGSIDYETDDFTATAAVLFDRTDAVLVSDDNPLVLSHLNGDLVEVYRSAPVSMSVVAVRRDSLTPAQFSALEQVLDGFAQSPETEPIRQALLFDGFRRMEHARFVADFRGGGARRELELALPSLGAATLDPLPALGSDEIPFVVGIELIEVEIPNALVDSVLQDKSKAGSQ